MSAKHKLNAANFVGSMLLAGLVGSATGSFLVFVIALATLLIASLHSRDIRR